MMKMKTVTSHLNPVLWIAIVCLMMAVACSSNSSKSETPATQTSSSQAAQGSEMSKMAPATPKTAQTATQPTETAQTPQTEQKTTSGDPSAVTIQLVAKDIAFDKKTITVPAGAQVTIDFDNKDSGIPHNFSLYETSKAEKELFDGKIITGPSTITYTFTAPSTPGEYFFRCDVHPTVMTGTFVVK
jgi:plastocyanin